MGTTGAAATGTQAGKHRKQKPQRGCPLARIHPALPWATVLAVVALVAAIASLVIT